MDKDIRHYAEGGMTMSECVKYQGQNILLQTTKGYVKGYTFKGIHVFKGIPYAKARRFHAPEPVETWEGVLDATSYGYVCPLLQKEKPQGELKIPHRYWLEDENCQNLNIWTPGCDGEKRPVFVWLHGGGFESGSSVEEVAYDGANLSKYGDAVVISLNHRLNVLGFFDLSDFGEEYKNSGNAGMDDIIAALKWIRENVALFGGDPDNVTLFGQSGGGAKITTLLQMPAADCLYAKGICMSGMLENGMQDCKGSGKELAQAVMKELEIEDVKELEKIPYKRLAQAFLKVRPSFQKSGGYIAGNPLPNEFYAGNPLHHGFRTETSGVPLLVGTVFAEFAGFMRSLDRENYISEDAQYSAVTKELGEEAVQKLKPLFTKAYPQRPFSDILSLDYLFRYPTQEYIQKRGALNKATYAYLFDYDFPVEGGTAAWHCADIPFVFHNVNLVEYAPDESALKLEEIIFHCVMAFARTGNPNVEGLPDWKPSTASEEFTMIFGEQVRTAVNHDRELIPVFRNYMSKRFEKMKEENRDQLQH